MVICCFFILFCCGKPHSFEFLSSLWPRVSDASITVNKNEW